MNQSDGDKFEVFFDGQCPLCRQEIKFLLRMDCRNRICFTDIASPHFSESSVGLSVEQLMAEIHGRTTNGQWVVGVEVFRRLYDLLGWTWVVAPTRWPVIRNLCDLGYRWFARNRLRLTGRTPASSHRVQDCSEQMT